jgi:hypothetical protein
MPSAEAVPYYQQILDGACYEMALHGHKQFRIFRDYFKPKFEALGGVWAPEWNYDDCRSYACKRAFASDVAGSDRERLTWLFWLGQSENPDDPYDIGPDTPLS